MTDNGTLESRVSVNGYRTFFAVYDPVTAGMVSDLGAKKVTVEEVGLPPPQSNGNALPASSDLLESLMQQQNRHEHAVEQILQKHTDRVSDLIDSSLQKLASDAHIAAAMPPPLIRCNTNGWKSSMLVKNLSEYRKRSDRKGLLEELQKKDMQSVRNSSEEGYVSEVDSFDGTRSSDPDRMKSIVPAGGRHSLLSVRLGLPDRTGSVWDSFSETVAAWMTRTSTAPRLRQARTEVIDIVSVLNENHCCTPVMNRMKLITSQRKFEVFASGLILANAIVIGIQANDAMERLDNSDVPIAFNVMNLVFTALFTIELFMRMIADGCCFFSYWNNSFGWNIFDTTIVVCALVDLLVSQFVNQDDSSSEVSSVRMLRMLRLIRIMRLVRVMRFFQDLRNMVTGIINSLKQLMWALLLLTLIMYLIAVCFLQVISEYLGSSSYTGLNDAGAEEFVLKNFGNLLRSIYTLYMAICGGVDWGDVAEPLMSISWILGPLFTLYIAFSVFCVLNIVTGVFVESANKLTKADEDTQNMEEMDRRKRWLEKVREAFIGMDKEGKGEISLQNLELYLSDIKGQLVIHRLGLDLDLTNAREFFRLLDNNANGSLSSDEFIAGCKEMRGSARGFEIARIHHDTLKLRSEVTELHEVISELLHSLTAPSVEYRSSTGSAAEPVLGRISEFSLPGSISCPV